MGFVSHNRSCYWSSSLLSGEKGGVAGFSGRAERSNEVDSCWWSSSLLSGDEGGDAGFSGRGERSNEVDSRRLVWSIILVMSIPRTVSVFWILGRGGVMMASLLAEARWVLL